MSEEYAGQTGPCSNCGQSITIGRSAATGGVAKAATGKSSSATTIIIILVVVVLGLLLCGGMLTAMLLPAISAAREAANRTAAMNNMRQIMLGVHNYHDVNQSLPPGCLPNEGLPPEERLSWMVELLPYVEQGHIYDRIPLDQPWDADPTVTQMQIQTFRTGLDEALLPEMTDFVGMAGVGADAATLQLDDPAVGAFGYDRQISFGNVTDGTSNTFAVFETHRKNGPWAQGGPSTVRGINLTDLPVIGENRQFGRAPGSLAAMLDASARSLDPNISVQVLQSGATIHGGEDFSMY